MIFIVSLLVVILPWTFRNLVVYGELIPFTIDGSFILFQGTYIKGDSDIINNVRKISEFAEIEQRAKEKSVIEQHHYWQALAIEQIRRDPLGQLRLCVRKALRFWTYLPQHSWAPSPKTAVVAVICLPLACFGFMCRRRCPLIQLCALWVSGLWLFHAIIHAELRYNFPILPMMFTLVIVGSYQLLLRLVQDKPCVRIGYRSGVPN